MIILFVYIISFNLSQKARVRYIIKPPTRVVNDAYIKKRRTLLTFIPSESANLVQTVNPYFSKKCRMKINLFILLILYTLSSSLKN